MNKAQGKSMATQRAVARDDSDITLPKWLVISFRRGKNNQGKPCVYRSVSRGYWKYEAAEFQAHVEVSHGKTSAYVVNVQDKPECLDAPWSMMLGDGRARFEWMEQRKGINRDADWRFAATYMHRECRRKQALTAREEMKG